MKIALIVLIVLSVGVNLLAFIMEKVFKKKMMKKSEEIKEKKI